MDKHNQTENSSQQTLGVKLDDSVTYAVFFKLIGTVLSQFPSRDLFATLVEEQLFDGIPLELSSNNFKAGADLLAKWNNSLNGVLSDEAYHDLLADNTFLFAGLQEMAVPPWESFYFNGDRMVFQKESIDVRKCYQKYGLQVENLHSEPDDHIGFELIFIARLCELLTIANKDDSDTNLYEQSDAQLDKNELIDVNGEQVAADLRDFLAKHTQRWARKWANGVVEHAKTDFYKGIALMVPAALDALNASQSE